MSTILDGVYSYNAGPATTTIGTIVMSGPAANVGVVMFGITSDTVTSPQQMVNATFLITWDGSSITSLIKSAGGITSGLTWSINGGTATFAITPSPSAPAANVILHMLVIPNSSNVTINF